MKVLITGSHFTPAQAVITELQKGGNASTGSAKIFYIGRKHTMEGDKTPSVESRVLPGLGVTFIPIIAGRLRRYLSIGTIISLLKIPIGFIQSFWILLKVQPDIVVSFGGYVGVPVVICAWFLNIPVLIHEQTLVPGLANHISSFFASKIAISFDKKYSFPTSKTVLTGNPIRQELLDSKTKPSKEIADFILENRNLPLILITGGNQGSHIINQTVGRILANLTQKYAVIHQTGDSKFNDYEQLLEKASVLKNANRYKAVKFINAADFAYILRTALLSITRGGANTLLELSFIGVPSIIIPIPNMSRNEQVMNAKFFARAGLGEIIYQNELSEHLLWSMIEKIAKKETDYKTRAKEAKKVVEENGAKRIVLEILSILPRK